MPDIIQLLPDSVANQIAAGEVIQRPASAVKELLENSIDAGATEIKLIIKDAGKTLIQVIDNGKGMSETDARMSFERHATSKITKADDLFRIKTMGFRGEALASIAAVAQVEMKTRREVDQLGVLIETENSEIKRQEPCAAPVGTSIAVKHLFFNVPARRNFLKSDPVELRHIIEELQRVAIPRPHIVFSAYHNDHELFNLEATTLRQRISKVFGSNYNERLVPVDETTDIVSVSGFVLKPEFAKKTRGEQYFFLNDRFIKSPYLHHAIQIAYQNLLPEGSFPSYFLLLQVDPKTIDVNIHPTKTEIKFEDEKSVYMILRSAVKQALGKYNIAPTLDFDQEMSFQIPLPPKDRVIEAPTIKVDPNYNPFNVNRIEKKTESMHSKNISSNQQNWENLYTGFKKDIHSINTTDTEMPRQLLPKEETVDDIDHLFQIHRRYVMAQIKSGFIILDQQAAHERILYERLKEQVLKNTGSSQQQLYPITIQLNGQDLDLVNELKPQIEALGFDISSFGKDSIVVHGIPSEAKDLDAKELLEKILEEYKESKVDIKVDKHDAIARSLAKNMSIKYGRKLSFDEMRVLVDELFACSMPYTTAAGKPTLITISLDELEKRFKK